MLAHATIQVRAERPAAISCRAALPVVPRTACGGLRLTVRRNRAGRFFVLRRGHIVWRSSGSYPNDGTQIAFGTDSFAFATYRGGVYLTDLKGPERVVVRGRSRFPVGISGEGDLLVAGGSRLRVVSPAGETLRSYGYRTRNGYAFDGRTGTLLFVTPGGHLASGPPRSVRPRARLRGVDGLLALGPGRLLVFSGARDLVVVRRDGRVLARGGWRAALGTMDSGFELAPDGHAIAFRLSTAHPGDASGTASVYVLRAGQSAAKLVYRDRFGSVGCGAAAIMSWHGDDLLYRRNGGELAVVDTGVP